MWDTKVIYIFISEESVVGDVNNFYPFNPFMEKNVDRVSVERKTASGEE